MMQQWRVIGIRLRGGKTLNDGITVYMLGLMLVVGNVVLSLRPGGGDYSWSTKKYIVHTIAK